MPTIGSPSPETVSALLILVTIFHALAFILTSFRLWFRYHIRRFWWDDLLAALALLCDSVCMVAIWMHTAPLHDPSLNIEAMPTPAQSRHVHIISSWLNIILYTSSIWLARISIALSMVRIVPPAQSVNVIVLGVGGIFACMWAYILSCKSVVCSLDTSWYNSLIIRCPMPRWVALSQVFTDVLSDVILVALPLRFLWRVKLPTNQKIMVISVFSTSISVSIVSVVHTVYLVLHVVFIAGFTAGIESAVSLIVCNLLVIVTFFYRVIRNGGDLTEDLHDKNTRSSNHLTTVDLDFSGGSLAMSMTGAAAPTATNVSSVKFSTTNDKDMAFDSRIETGAPIHPAVSKEMGSRSLL